MYKLKTLTGGGACPEQYFGKTTEDEEIYIRIRGGSARIDINDKSVAYMDFKDDPYKGCFENSELAELLLSQFEPDKILIAFIHNYYN